MAKQGDLVAKQGEMETKIDMQMEIFQFLKNRIEFPTVPQLHIL